MSKWQDLVADFEKMKAKLASVDPDTYVKIDDLQPRVKSFLDEFFPPDTAKAKAKAKAKDIDKDKDKDNDADKGGKAKDILATINAGFAKIGELIAGKTPEEVKAKPGEFIEGWW
jgi:hypothetical protein